MKARRTPRERVLAALRRHGVRHDGSPSGLWDAGKALHALPFGVITMADVLCGSAAIALSAGCDEVALATLREGGVRA